MGMPRFLKDLYTSSESGPDTSGLTDEQKKRLVDSVGSGAPPADQPPAMAPTYTPPVAAVAPPDTATQTPQPIYSPNQKPADESMLVTRPVMNMADRYTAAAVPNDTPASPTYTSPASTAAATPNTTSDARLIPSGVTPTYDNKARPTGAEGGTPEQNQAEYLRILQEYHPSDHNGRLKSSLINAGRAYLRGGGLIGALTGAVQGAVDPGADERYQNEKDIGKVTRDLAGNAARKEAASKLLDEASQRAARDASTQRTLNPVYEPEVITAEDGTVTIVDKNKHTASPVYNPDKSPLKKKDTTAARDKFEVRHNPASGKAEKWKVGSDGEADTKVENWSDVKQDLVKTPAGWVAPGTKLMADATAGQRQTQNATELRKEGVAAANRAEDKTTAATDKAEARRQKAGQLVGKLNGARTRWMAADAKATQLRTQMQSEQDDTAKADLQKQVDGWEFERSKAQTEAADAATELNANHSDLYEAGIGTGGLAYYKTKPFDVKKWRVRYPKATAAQQAAAIQNAKDAGMEIVQ